MMMLIVPAMAFDPKRAEPPPRSISTRSTMLAGICSKPYTPASELHMGRLSIKYLGVGAIQSVDSHLLETAVLAVVFYP